MFRSVVQARKALALRVDATNETLGVTRLRVEYQDPSDLRSPVSIHFGSHLCRTFRSIHDAEIWVDGFAAYFHAQSQPCPA